MLTIINIAAAGAVDRKLLYIGRARAGGRAGGRAGARARNHTLPLFFKNPNTPHS